MHMVTDAPIAHIYYEDFFGAGNSKILKKVIRYHPFGIGIGTDIVFDISLPESTTGGTEIPKYQISFGIPSSELKVILALSDHGKSYGL